MASTNRCVDANGAKVAADVVDFRHDVGGAVVNLVTESLVENDRQSSGYSTINIVSLTQRRDPCTDQIRAC